MKVTAETLPERQVRLEIAVDDARQAQAVEQAYKKLAPQVRVPGFRPGKAPRAMIEKQLGHHRLLDEAMDILLPQVYKEAIDEQDLNPVDSPDVELVSHEPLVFKATVPLAPVIELGDYSSLKMPAPTVAITDDEVDKAMLELRRRYGTIEPVDRPAAKGDIVRGNLRANAEDAVLFEQNDIEYHLTDESLASLPGLVDHIVGLKKGDDVEKTSDVPEDHVDSRLAGKTATYKISVHEVKEEKPAAEDDAFAKEVGEGFETILALRVRIREDMQKAAEETATRNYEAELLDAVTEQATVDYPTVLVEREIDHILEDQANIDPRDPRAVDLYLERLGKSESDVRESVRDEAVKRLRRSLVLSQFAEAENISVDESDIDAEIEKMAGSAGEQAEVIRTLFNTENARDTLRRSVLTRKTFARLIETAGAEATAKPAAKATPKQPAKPRRSTPRKAQDTTEESATTNQEKE